MAKFKLLTLPTGRDKALVNLDQVAFIDDLAGGDIRFVFCGGGELRVSGQGTLRELREEIRNLVPDLFA